MAAMDKSIQIFKAGKHTAMSGLTLQFTEQQLIDCAAAYSPDVFEAPLVVGHPKLDDAAYGWVKSLSFADGLLHAEPNHVDADFAELVKTKKFPKVSASFYLPDSPNNPMPGVLYLKHVGFLGAAAPAVKGLKTVSFAADEQGVVEFADWDQMTVAGLFRSIREWIIGKDGTETADQVLPNYQIESLQLNAAQKEIPSTIYPSFMENDEMTPEQKAKMDALEAENAALKTNEANLKTQVASFAEQAAATKKESLHAQHVSFAEDLVKQGKLLPAGKEVSIALMDKLAAEESEIEFGEGEAKTKKTALEMYKDQLSAAPQKVEFGEHKGDGTTLDDAAADPMLLAQKAVEFAESEAAQGRIVNSAQAVQHVKNQISGQ